MSQELNILNYFIYGFTKMQRIGRTNMGSNFPVHLVDLWASKNFKGKIRVWGSDGCILGIVNRLTFPAR